MLNSVEEFNNSPEIGIFIDRAVGKFRRAVIIIKFGNQI